MRIMLKCLNNLWNDLFEALSQGGFYYICYRCPKFLSHLLGIKALQCGDVGKSQAQVLKENPWTVETILIALVDFSGPIVAECSGL